MNFQIEGKLVHIGKPHTVGVKGGTALSIFIDTGEKFDNNMEFGMYRPSQKLHEIQTFMQGLTVGVDYLVHFNIRCVQSKDKQRMFTNLNVWRVEPQNAPVNQNPTIPIQQAPPAQFQQQPYPTQQPVQQPPAQYQVPSGQFPIVNQHNQNTNPIQQPVATIQTPLQQPAPWDNPEGQDDLPF